jgi:Xaa-Pro aminopeptidase
MPLRGIGVRIEDDILITSTGNENLTAMLPRSSVDVEAWISSIWAGLDNASAEH